MREEPAIIEILRSMPHWRGNIAEIASALSVTEKQARSAIDKARLDGYNVKNVDLRTFQLQPVIGLQTKP